MDKFLDKLAMMLIALTLCVGMASCSDDDDEPAYDPSNPMIGTWECVSYDNVDMCFTNSDSWTYVNGVWEEDFQNEWIGHKVKITKDTKFDNGDLWLSDGEHPSGQLYANDETYIYNIKVDESGNSMTASVHYKHFLSIDDYDWVKYRGTLNFKRK